METIIINSTALFTIGTALLVFFAVLWGLKKALDIAIYSWGFITGARLFLIFYIWQNIFLSRSKCRKLKKVSKLTTD